MNRGQIKAQIYPYGFTVDNVEGFEKYTKAIREQTLREFAELFNNHDDRLHDDGVITEPIIDEYLNQYQVKEDK
jgi:hypothetical protein